MYISHNEQEKSTSLTFVVFRCAPMINIMAQIVHECFRYKLHFCYQDNIQSIKLSSAIQKREDICRTHRTQPQKRPPTCPRSIVCLHYGRTNFPISVNIIDMVFSEGAIIHATFIKTVPVIKKKFIWTL